MLDHIYKNIDVLKKKLNEYDILYVPINDFDSFIKIHDLYMNDIMFDPSNETECGYIGMYYECIKPNYIDTEKYFLMMVDYDPINVTHCLILNFYNVKKDHGKMEKYFLNIIDDSHSHVWKNLVSYYSIVKHNLSIAIEDYMMAFRKYGTGDVSIDLTSNFIQAKKNYKNLAEHYDTAIENGYVDAINRMANYYKYIEKDDVNSVKYYLMAIDHGDVFAMYNLACHYEEINNFEDAIKYYLMAIDHGSGAALEKLFAHYKNRGDIILGLKLCIENDSLIDRKKIINEINKIWIATLDAKQNKCFMEILSGFEFMPDDEIPTLLRTFSKLLKENVDVMKLHFEYTIQGKGFNEAKNDFIDMLTKINN